MKWREIRSCRLLKKKQRQMVYVFILVAANWEENVGFCLIGFFGPQEENYLNLAEMNLMLSLAVGVGGLAFIGYCVYFDKKRRSDPNFKEKLRARRKAAREAQRAALKRQIPHPKDNEALRKFFLQEVHLGEELLCSGDYANGVEHLANAVVVCSQPQQLLNILNNTLPPEVFQMLIQQLASIRGQQQEGEFGPQILGMAEEDVE